jgi:SAM-dependent methyltransferase
MAHPERIVPDETPRGPLAIHEKRYRFALPYVAGLTVLDAACGVGYGSAILAEQAERVVAVDLSEDAVAYARGRYARPNVEYRTADLLAPDLPDAAFDAVVSFETIEHLPDREAYLGHVTRMLRPGGVYLVSTPRVDETTETPENPHHRVEYDRRDFEELLGRYFGEIELYGQRRPVTRRHAVLRRLDVLGLRRRVPALRRALSHATGSEPLWDVGTDGIVIDREALGQATELFAVCRRPLR